MMHTSDVGRSGEDGLVRDAVAVLTGEILDVWRWKKV
jgi:hypothetical protein